MDSYNKSILFLVCFGFISTGYLWGLAWDEALKPSDPSIDFFRTNCYLLDSNFRMTINWMGIVESYSCWNPETGESMLGS